MSVLISSLDVYELIDRIETFVSESTAWCNTLKENSYTDCYMIELMRERQSYLQYAWYTIDMQLKQINSGLASLFSGNNHKGQDILYRQVHSFSEADKYIRKLDDIADQIYDQYLSDVDMMGFIHGTNAKKMLREQQPEFCVMWSNVIKHSLSVLDTLRIVAKTVRDLEPGMSVVYASPPELFF